MFPYIVYFLPRFFRIRRFLYSYFSFSLIHYVFITISLFLMVEVRRFELLTPCLQSRCSPS